MANFTQFLAEVNMAVEEQHSIAVAYEKVIAARLGLRRIISSVEQSEASRGNDVTRIHEYRRKIESELSKICDDILHLLDDRLIADDSANLDLKVLYLKMKGDYLKHKTELKSGDDRKDAIEHTLKAYEVAQDIANKELPPIHPIRLGLALSLYDLHCQILNSPDLALSLAKQAYETAVTHLRTRGKASCKDEDISSIMYLLRGKLVSRPFSVDDERQRPSMLLNCEGPTKEILHSDVTTCEGRENKTKTERVGSKTTVVQDEDGCVAICIVTKDGVLLAANKRTSHKEPRVAYIDDYMLSAVTGSDAERLVQYARDRYDGIKSGESVSVELLLKALFDHALVYENNVSQPFDVSLILAGHDDRHQPCLYFTNSFEECIPLKFKSIGRNFEVADSMLEEKLEGLKTESLSMEDAERVALSVLKCFVKEDEVLPSNFTFWTLTPISHVYTLEEVQRVIDFQES